MKNYIRFYIVLAVLLASSSSAMAQTLHAIIFCNTIDPSIGASMERDLNIVTNEIKKLAEATGYDDETIPISGPSCTRTFLKQTIDDMYVEEDDIIITFYGGHGSHAKNNDEDPWPQYCMNTGFENQNNWVPMALLAKWVQAKNPRLAIILSNCCNGIQAHTTVKELVSMGYSMLPENSADNFKKLLSQNGLVMATSSKLAELSWCNMETGGLYTKDLLRSLDMVGSGTIEPTWEALLKNAFDLCSARDIVGRDGVHYKQHPYYEVKLKGDAKNPTPKTDGRSPKIKNNPLEQALLDLVDKSVSESTRLKMIPSIIEKYFSGYSLVLTVGTDMETVYDNEKPKDFLRRICLSPYILRVNVVRDEDGMLTVHEIRRQ